MTNRSKPDVEVFAGIDVSAREISVARLRGKEENPKLATFANSPSGHKVRFWPSCYRGQTVYAFA
jgi:hypothetical protein